MSVRQILYTYFETLPKERLVSLKGAELAKTILEDLGVHVIKTTANRYRLYYLAGERKSSQPAPVVSVRTISVVCHSTVEFFSVGEDYPSNPYAVLKHVTKDMFTKHRGPDKYKIDNCREARGVRSHECSGKFVRQFEGQVFCCYCIEKNHAKLARLLKIDVDRFHLYV